ncbi:Na+/H+ antiporter NhaC family protein [Marinomonas mediterranea]|jgi:transporter, NhaC family (TC 2.A.35)|uniref:Na+/H+ antiporter NhaC-like protein n=1 Tax=Marinomonas mediterranea (strain ATCC 700492 / JCM 21426 / NBRC 103028 / MMB-1) TaxID=717774 RepID=F2JUQ9_MARM1|nr:Na+/H+ antiporter NhaC family protein [Marinomonas mediterranea]ADZ90474.1 Na+/H+ antiporter NhaC-like protein [Marinomonas mediterranea MMB-1]WCN08529.1 sodium:proton antiporter [Marinomonas mediterranea]WCN12583.1 sodium:proton antiporter [Marinomonas mediterranea]WCN16654.1 sodium:proton antiporter [Marinomonas mediterranea MMB-1]
MEQVIRVLSGFRPKRSILPSALITLACFALFWFLSELHGEGDEWGAVSLLPTIFVLLVALVSRAPFEALLTGVVAGLIMLDNSNVVTPLADTLSAVMGDGTIVWVVLVCGLMGGLIVLLERSGCLGSFSGWLKGCIKSRKQSLLTTFLIGLVVFIDDYLNCLAVSSSVKQVTDSYKVSREKLAYIIDSTAAPMCILVPVSTWAVYFSGLLEANDLAASGEGLSVYISAIPYMIYGWVALAVVFLVASNVIGDFGPMKKAEQRALNGQPIPDDFNGNEMEANSQSEAGRSSFVGMMNFIVPMLLLIFSTIYYDIDLLRGVILTLGVTIVLYYVQGLLSLEQQFKGMFEGFKVMLYPLSTVVAGFMLKEVNDQLGMTQYVVGAVAPYMTAELLPAFVFLVMALVVFGTASSWGSFIIAIPIVVPIALNVDANMPLVIGALLSASSFGSHACFFSDSTVLAAQGAGCSPMSHALTQAPYALLGAVISFAAFVMLGYMI